MAWSPGIWKRGSLHRTLLTGCSEVQCKLPLSIADGLLIIDEHKSGSSQFLGGGGSRRGGCSNSISVTLCQNCSPLLIYHTIASALNSAASLFAYCTLLGAGAGSYSSLCVPPVCSSLWLFGGSQVSQKPDKNSLALCRQPCPRWGISCDVPYQSDFPSAPYFLFFSNCW